MDSKKYTRSTTFQFICPGGGPWKYLFLLRGKQYIYTENENRRWEYEAIRSE